jgi:hypothetical protein
LLHNDKAAQAIVLALSNALIVGTNVDEKALILSIAQSLLLQYT